jgi:hypothetical protein
VLRLGLGGAASSRLLLLADGELNIQRATIIICDSCDQVSTAVERPRYVSFLISGKVLIIHPERSRLPADLGCLVEVSCRKLALAPGPFIVQCFPSLPSLSHQLRATLALTKHGQASGGSGRRTNMDQAWLTVLAVFWQVEGCLTKRTELLISSCDSRGSRKITLQGFIPLRLVLVASSLMTSCKHDVFYVRPMLSVLPSYINRYIFYKNLTSFEVGEE